MNDLAAQVQAARAELDRRIEAGTIDDEERQNSEELIASAMRLTADDDFDHLVADMLAEHGLAVFTRDIERENRTLSAEDLALAKRIIVLARERVIANGEAALRGIRGLAMPAHEQAVEQVLGLAKMYHAEALRAEAAR